MFRLLLACVLACLLSINALANFSLTGNPATDQGWIFGGHSLSNGGYVRNQGNFGFNMYYTEFRLLGGPLTTMPNPWAVNSRVVGLGGVFTAPMTPESLGWPPGTVFTGPAQNSQIGANTRINAKFGANAPDNIYSASTIFPNMGNGNGSHSGGQGGLGSILVSIASNRFTAADANILITPNNLLGPGVPPPGDSVTQWQGVVGSNGLDLGTNQFYDMVRYIYNVDSNGFLSSWEVLLNTSMVANFPGAILPVPTGGRGWIQTASFGAAAVNNTDGIIFTQVFFEVPAPPAVYAAAAGLLGLIACRRRFRGN